MFEIALTAFAALVVALVVERTRELGFRAPVELGPIRGRDRTRLMEALVAAAPRSAPGAIARLAVPTPGVDGRQAGAEGDVDAVELEVAVREQHRRLGRGLRALRVLAACASALGFAGAVAAIASIHSDHGLLDLDPERIARAALGEASRVLALGLGTSAFALSSLVVLQERARVVGREVDRVADLHGRASRAR